MEVLKIHAYDWVVKNNDDHSVIYCWALDYLSRPYLLIINHFPLFCMIELPMLKGYTWTNSTVKLLIEELNKMGCKINTDQGGLIHLKNLYYYQGNNKIPYYQAHFNSMKDLRRCQYKLDN